MDEIDRILAGMQRELDAQESEISALGKRLAAGENGVRAELNPAIRHARRLASGIFELKREYQRFGPMELAEQGGCCCCHTTSHRKPSPEQALASQKEVAQLEMEFMPQLSVLTVEAVELLAWAWNDPKGAIRSRADMCGPTHADERDIGEEAYRWPAARWQATVRVLEDLDLVERPRGRLVGFELTWKGYRVAGLIHRGALPPML